MNFKLIGPLACLAFVLTSCQSAPPLGSEVKAIRVVTFALEWDVRIGGASGVPEPTPSLFGGDFEGFPKPLRESVANLWSAFPSTAERLTGRGPWSGPESPDSNSAYAGLGEEEMDRNAAVFPAPLSRAYLWPGEFRFIDPSTVSMEAVAQLYPGEWLLIVQHRAFAENVGDDTDYKKADFKMGLVSRLRLYSPQGKLWSDDTLVGFSTDRAKKRGAVVDRTQYPRLIAQAQDDVLKQWSLRPQFRTVGSDR